MTTKRKKHTAQFKFKVALEAVRNLKTRNQIASQFEVHPTQVGQWKKTLVEKGSAIFETPHHEDKKKQDKQETELYEQIGRLKMELEWLKKKSGQISF
jgi:transposase-like protein